MVRQNLGWGVYKAWVDNTQATGSEDSHQRVFFEGNYIYSYGHHFCMGIRYPWGFLLNGDIYSATTLRHQSALRSAVAGRVIATIPFSSLREAGIFPESPVELVASEGDRYVEIRCRRRKCCILGVHTHPRHLLGRCVVRCGSDYWLSGVDETMADLWHGHFLTKLPVGVNTVAEAVEALKPPAVKEAEACGVGVLRQGEWFFIPTGFVGRGVPATLPHREVGRVQRHRVAQFATGANGTMYARGTVRHIDGDHRMLTLGRAWYSVHENTELASFRGRGRVD